MVIPDGNAAALNTALDRRHAILESALATFARFGYRKTSMEEVARAAHISRPGLYFLFSSKEELFRAAVSRALEADLAEVEQILSSDRPFPERLLDAFDRWAGRYIGALARDIPIVIEANPELLGDLVVSTPKRFESLVTEAIAADRSLSNSADVVALTQTVISLAIGIKHQAADRDDFNARLKVAIGLLFR